MDILDIEFTDKKITIREIVKAIMQDEELSDLVGQCLMESPLPDKGISNVKLTVYCNKVLWDSKQICNLELSHEGPCVHQ